MTPFIYISALRRTGSTVLSESLTSIPYSFIFREPRLGCGRFMVKSSDAQLFLEHGIDLKVFSSKWSGTTLVDKLLQRNRLVATFEQELMPKLLAVFQQIGVKEIHHTGWKFYAEAFSDIRFVLTARDPRDIFISTYYRVKAGKDHFRQRFSAQVLARDLNRDFRHQRAISDVHPFFKVRYEELCSDQRLIDDIKTFVGSQLDGAGRVGQFNAANPHRMAEAALHGGTITEKRVERWKNDTDKELVQEAHRMFDLMPEFVEFWGYER